MNITAKSIQHSNAVFIFSEPFKLIPEEVLTLFPVDQGKGVTYADHPSLGMRYFEFPAQKLKIIQDGSRLRFDDLSQQAPEASKLAARACELLEKLFPHPKVAGYGFNYDIFFRFDNVIPQREMMGYFVDEAIMEQVKDFGWQFTLANDKGQKVESYFLKAISPLEIAMHKNLHLAASRLPGKEKMQELFEQGYEQAGDIVKHFKL